MGEPLGIGLENEKAGLIPTTAWKEKKYGKKWLSGETLSVAIGQGYVLATPLQLAEMTAEVANEGTVYAPHLVKKVVSPEGKVLQEFHPTVIRRVESQGQNLASRQERDSLRLSTTQVVPARLPGFTR